METLTGLSNNPFYLVIDDEPMIHSILCRSFRDAGCGYAGALDGYEGLRLARERRPDLILLDVSMPSLDGRDVLCEIRRDESLAGVPVVVITGHADQLSRLHVLEAGADEVVEKPFDPVILQRRLAWMVQKAAEEAISHA